MRVLVTGGAGFIGSHLCVGLVRAGYDVRVLDDLSGGSRENLRAVRRDVELRLGDCADPAAVRRAVRGVEVVFHEAALPSVTRSVQEPARSHRNNATATVTLLEAARDAGVRRVIYAGSSSVYGDSKALPKRESHEPQPMSPYGVGKLMGEHYLRVFHQLYELETLTLRYFNVFGPRQAAGSPYSGVISLFATALLSGKAPVIHGDGGQTRDFTYVQNVVDANLLAMRAPGARGQALNVATGRRISLRQLLDAMNRELGTSSKAQRAPARSGDIRHSLADIGRARRALGYRPGVSFEEGLRKTLAWYREALSRPGRSRPRSRGRAR
jgi:UDP-glucose 4-epimerase